MPPFKDWVMLFTGVAIVIGFVFFVVSIAVIWGILEYFGVGND